MQSVLSKRRDEIVQDIERLNTELVEIETVESLFARYSDTNRRSLSRPRLSSRATSSDPGRPSISAMIIDVLKAASFEGDSGLSPKEITDQIVSRWPSLRGKGSHVNSVVWRLAKAGRVNRVGHFYSWPPNSEADAPPARAFALPQPSESSEPDREAPHDLA